MAFCVPQLPAGFPKESGTFLPVTENQQFFLEKLPFLCNSRIVSKPTD